MEHTSQEYISSLCSTLNTYGVPSVLWGHCLLRVHGIPSGIGSIDFVVPDDLIDDSVRALTSRERELKACLNDDSCLAGSHNRFTPPPAYHFHMTKTRDLTVGLFLQSETLWFLPPLSKTLLCVPEEEATNSPFISATDSTILPPWRPGRGSGVFTSTDSAKHVLVPRAPVLLEAYMRLHARDSGKQVGTFSLAMVDYMTMYVDEDGYLDVMLLSDPFRAFYQRLKVDEGPIRNWTRDLKTALGMPFEDEIEE